jgi:SecD/SecF fusion protein
MAIRNGFGRAMSAIVDSNLTTIISGIVLFYIGTDQVKGFAITLVLGILTSMFTAIFVARLIFDIAERRGWIKQLRMMHIFSKPNFDFLRLRWIMLVGSWTLIGIGMIAAYFRGSQLLDIDFTGGSSVTFTLNDKDKMSLADVRNVLVKTDLADKNLLIVGRGDKNTGYTVDTSEQEVDKVKGAIVKEFGDKLKRYSLEFQGLKPVADADFTGTEAKLLVNAGPEYADEKGMTHDALEDQIVLALAKQGHPGVRVTLTNPEHRTGSSVRLPQWTARFTGLDEAETRGVLEHLQTELQNTPLFPLANTIGGRVSANMQFQALLATSISIVAMIIYLWLRFHKPAYGIAAGVALIHDVLMTIGMIALSYYIVEAVPALAHALRIDSFQINLTIVAALLTIIGYSVNDTIVTFDRLREIKGKTPRLTAKMVNDSINQTLSRTILTVFTVFIVVVVLYLYGGAGLHSFAFAFLVGVVVGTYSSIYVASPVLLWLSGVSAAQVPEAPATTTRRMQPAR